MKKEEFLAMSLPFDLMIAEINDDGLIVRKSMLCPSRYHDFATHDYYKPIIRQLSDLTKPIEHNGEKFVPIVELAKISWITEYVNFKFQSLKEDSVFIAFSDKKNVFGYDSNAQSFFGGLDGKPCSVVNQLQLFQKLIEWHFDIAGLIEKGEAIDVNTLPENPYK